MYNLGCTLRAPTVDEREKLAQQRLFEAEADVEVKHREDRNSDIALFEINQEFESQETAAATGESLNWK